MNRTMRRVLSACAILTAVLAVPGVARADVIGEWNATAQAETTLIRPTAHGQSRGIAMVQGAVYDAVNAIDGGHRPYLLEETFQPFGSQDAAAATAAHHVLVEIVDDSRVEALDDAYQDTLDAILAGPITAEIFDEGVEAGEAAAAAMLAFRENDGFMAPFDFTLVIGPDPGDWRPVTPTALDPDAWVGDAKPFLIESPSQFRSEGPDPLTSAAYADDYNEVKELGALNSAKRTADETAAAVFWQFPPIVLYNRLARDLAARFGLDTTEQARLYAMINLAAADGAISCWNDKWYWSFWRPRAAIREGDTDRNPATTGDPVWESLFAPQTATTPALATPPFPDHPSGHGCVTGATMHAFQDFFGTDKVAFDVIGGRSLNGVLIPPRHFERFSHALKEVIDARVWGGIHFRNADVQGAVIGKKVAHWLRKHYFQPVR